MSVQTREGGSPGVIRTRDTPGIFSAGSAMGAIVAPPAIAWITLQFGWRYAFLIPGLLGLIWLPVWWATYRPLASHREPESSSQPWSVLLRQRTVWGLVLSRLFSDPVWYFYLFWLPDYLQRERHLSLAQVGFYGWIPFLFADLGSLAGGFLSDFLIGRGIAPARARMVVLAGVACMAPIGALAGVAPSAAGAIAATCLVAFLTQCWSTNTATLVSDVLPDVARGSAMGLMGTAGSLAGACFAQVLGFVIGRFGYPAAFGLAAVLHPCAIAVLVLMLWPVVSKQRSTATAFGY